MTTADSSQITCPICKHRQTASALDCENCGAAFVYQEPDDETVEASPSPSRRARRGPAPPGEHPTRGDSLLTHPWNRGCLGTPFRLALVPFRAILVVALLFLAFQIKNLTRMTGDLMTPEQVHIDKNPKERIGYRVVEIGRSRPPGAPKHPTPEPADLVFEMPADAIELSPEPDGYENLDVDQTYVVPFRCVIEEPTNSARLASGEVPLGLVELQRNPSTYFGSDFKLEPATARVSHRDLGAWVWPHSLEEVERPIGWSRWDVRNARHDELAEEVGSSEFERARIREYLLEGYLLVQLPIERHREFRASFKSTAFYRGDVYWLYSTPLLPDEGPLLRIGTDVTKSDLYYSIHLQWGDPCARREHKSVMQQYLGN